MNVHTSSQFDADLEHIRTGVLQMGGLVETQLVRAMEGLRKGQLDTIDDVIEGDRRINDLEIQLDDACGQIIARRQPAASDLRMVLTVLRIINDLERIGDEAKKIAKAAKRLHSGEVPFVPKVDLSHGAEQAADMLRRALDSFARADVSDSADIVRQDAEVDASFKAIMRQLITFMMEDPRTISSSLEVLFMAKSIERVGDHAKNISEYVVYMTQGSDVRHSKADEIERELERDNRS